MQASIYKTDKTTAYGGQDFEQRLLPLRQRIYKLAYRNLGNREDAEDITQETFVRAWTHYTRFEAGRSLDAWVARIAINLCLDTARRRRRHRTVSLDAPPPWSSGNEPEGYQVTDNTQDPVIRLLEAEVDQTLQGALHTLPAPYRQCVQLLEQRHTYQEISALLNCPVGTIRSRLHRARGLIRKQLETNRIG
jgi:RNA polymerase sigma-70 factor, ECF subfamily